MKNNNLPLPLLRQRLVRTMNDVKNFCMWDIINQDSAFWEMVGNLRSACCDQVIALDESQWAKVALCAYNAAVLFLDTYDEVIEDGNEPNPEVSCAVCDMRNTAEMVIKAMNIPGCELRYFTCANCGAELQLYTYSDIEDTRKSTGCEADRFNTRAVYEFMHQSHFCDACWQNCIYDKEL